MFSVKRPSSKDTDEDLLKLQEEFLKEKSKPAAKTESKNLRLSERTFKESPSKSNGKLPDEVEVPSKHVMFDIKERNIASPTVVLPSRKADPFPAVSRRNTNVKNVKGNKSIFAHQMEKMRTQNLKKASLVSASTTKFPDSPVLIDGSGLENVSAETEAKTIHEENIAKLSALTEQEILVERSLLLEKLDPKLIEFIQKKKKSGPTKNPENLGIEVALSEKNQSCVLPEKSSDHVYRNSYRTRERFPLPSSASANEPSEEVKILKVKGHDHDAVILENMPQEIIHDQQTEMDPASLSHKNSVDLNTVEDKDVKLVEEELPINLKDTAAWLHMDKVEKRKLEWMTMLPKPNPVDIKSGHTARFDFQGKLLPHDESVPTQKGLHHHSEEPELPGYTIEELFLLARSSFQSQRVMALQILAFVLENNWQGTFDGCFEEPLLIQVLNAGIAPLLRWALDDSSDSSVAAAVMAIHHLLICSTDELCLDITFPWKNGHLSPFIKPSDTDQVSEESLKDLTDAGLIKLDVIKGFLRMDLLPRLRYILIVTCPPLRVCQLIIEILIRIARHSSESAKKVMECPFLIETIFKKFLPATWDLNSKEDETKKTDDFVFPVPCAVKLVRVISSSSTELASDLITNHNLDSSLSYYLSLGLSDATFSAVALQKLVTETLRTWQVLLTYGFCCDIYINLFPLLLRQLQYFLTTSVRADSGIHAADCMYMSLFFKALETVVTIAADCNKSPSGSNLSYNVSPLTWNHVTALLPMVESCLQKWLHEFTHGGTTMAGCVLLGSCVDFFNVYCTIAQEQLDVGSPEAKNKFQNMIGTYVIPCLQSVRFASFLDSLRSYSVLLYDGLSGTKRNTSTLASLGSILWEDDIVPILKEGTPFPLITSVIGLLTSVFQLLPSFDEKPAKIIMLHPSVVKYIKAVAGRTTHFSHWFDRFEVAFIYQLIELASVEVYGDPSMWHKLSLSILSSVRTSDEWIIKYLMENIIFKDTWLLYHVGRSPALIDVEERTQENNDLKEQCCASHISKEKLRKIGQVYVNFFLSASSIKKSRCKWFKTTYDWPISIEDDLQSIVPHDWPSKPLLVLYQRLKNSKILSSDLTMEVTAFLEWICLSQKLQLSSFKHISPLILFCHLCLVYTLGSDVFYNMEIKGLLQLCLHMLVEERKLRGLEKVQWNNTSKFDDLLSALVVQFEAESYGDHVFANYLLIAFQQCYPSRWKEFVFVEHPQAVRIIGVPLPELIIPVSNFLEPKETDTDLLTLYFKALSSGLLIPERNPLLYLMAVHHLHHYIFMTSDKLLKFQETLLNSIMRCRKKEVIHHVLLYKYPNESETLGFEMDECITAENELYLSRLYGKPIML